MPIYNSSKDYYDKESALWVVKQFDVESKDVDITLLFNAHKNLLPKTEKTVVYANLKGRLRTATIYYYANSLNYIVLGTVNKGELSIGHFPKNASAGDILPIGDLLKREIKEIGRTYNLPEDLVSRKASGCIWAETAEEEWGFTEETLDAMIETFENEGEKRLLEIFDETEAMNFLEKYNESAHKRKYYPVWSHK